MSPVGRLNRSRRCTVGTVYLRGGFIGGALESGSVRRWVGVEEMGVEGDLLPRMSSLGVLLKNPNFKPKCIVLASPKRCILDPTWRGSLMWHHIKWCVLFSQTVVTNRVTAEILL